MGYKKSTRFLVISNLQKLQKKKKKRKEKKKKKVEKIRLDSFNTIFHEVFSVHVGYVQYMYSCRIYFPKIWANL